MVSSYLHVILSRRLATGPCLPVVDLSLEMPSPPKSFITPPADHTYSSQKAKEPDLREQIRKRN
jgi:hypothetical protein